MSAPHQRVTLHLTPQEDLLLGLRVASAAVGVIRRIDSPLAIASALAAAAGGDLAPAGATTAPEDAGDGDAQPLPPNPDSLLPLYPPGLSRGADTCTTALQGCALAAWLCRDCTAVQQTAT